MPTTRSTRILLVSNDVSLTSSRANLLTLAGYSADLELDQQRAVRRIRTCYYHLVIVSETFAPEEQLMLRSKLKQTRTELPVLLLSEHERDGVEFLSAVESFLGRIRTATPENRGLLLKPYPHAR